MPELPEVLTIKKDLKKEILGKKILNIKTYKKYPLKPTESAFKESTVGHTVEDVLNIAKLLAIKMSSGKYIATHLNMSGILLYNRFDPHVKITLEFDDKSKLNYSSVRMFGYFEVWDQFKLNEYSTKYGITALDPKLTKDVFADLVKKRRSPIKNILLDQKVVSGIGNIYANDALHMSRIHPKRKGDTLELKELEKLYNSVTTILEEGIENRGSSIDRYTDIYGQPGKQQKHFRIYGKKGLLCENCGTRVSYEKVSGRPTYYCESCQPEDMQTKML